MTKYKVEYGLDVPAYGEVELELDTEDPDEVIAKIKELYGQDQLLNDWNIHPDVGCDNYRIVHVFRLRTDLNQWEEQQWGYFDLDDGDYYEKGPYLWIAFNIATRQIDAHSSSREDLGMFETDSYKILKARL